MRDMKTTTNAVTAGTRIYWARNMGAVAKKGTVVSTFDGYLNVSWDDGSRSISPAALVGVSRGFTVIA